ncbi:MAG: hypothetical protein U5P41_16245 [Gammaproteobacteria bacterium]|nr:hypothetical protein [Gammaproteobacteria bacterium]
MFLAACLGFSLSACDDQNTGKFDQDRKPCYPGMAACDPACRFAPWLWPIIWASSGISLSIMMASIDAAQRNLRFNLGGIIGLRDTTGDGRMDQVQEFADAPGMEIDIRDNWLYFGAEDAVYRYRLGEALKPESPAELVIGGFRSRPSTVARPLPSIRAAIFMSISVPR